MKKYLFGILAIALAISFSAFTTPKALDEKFKLSLGVDPIDSNLEQTSFTIVDGSGVTYFTNWEVTVAYSSPAIADDKGCAVEVSADYSKDIGGSVGRKLLAVDPDGAGSKKAFPMYSVSGYLQMSSPFIQFKKISSSIEIENQISVKNRNTPHI